MSFFSKLHRNNDSTSRLRKKSRSALTRMAALGSAALAAKPGTKLLAAAAVAAAAAVLVERQARQAERDNPPSGRFIEVDGVRVHYVERGEGSPVVLLHGNTVLLQDFEGSGLIDRLAKSHRVIAFDRPGFGYSERPRDRLWTPEAQAKLLHDAFALLGIEQPVVVGHSWGTLVALALALDFKADVRGLVLVSGYYYPTARLDVPIAMLPAIPVLGDAMRYTVSPLTARLLLTRTIKIMFGPAPMPEHFYDDVSRELMLRPVQIRATAEDAAFMIPAAARFHERYGELQLPVKIVAGAKDRIVDVESHAMRLQQDLPNSELMVLAGLGHMVHYAVPDRIVAAVDAVAENREDAPKPAELAA